MKKPSHIPIVDMTSAFFDDEDRLLITPALLTTLKEENEMTFDMAHELWLDQVWTCMDDVVRLLSWREISTQPLHISRCLAKVRDTDETDLLDARHVLYRDEPTSPELLSRKEDQLVEKTRLFINQRNEIVHDEAWCTASADAFSRLLATPAMKKIGMNVFAFLDLLASVNQTKTHSGEKKACLELVGFELYARASISVLRGEELW